jgi:3-deoxy-D-manno-octulosonic-acid transferase
MSLIYSLSIFFYRLTIHAAALTGHAKAKQWVAGRKNILDHIAKSLLPNERRVWFHCASLGEFEQGRPLIEKFRIQKPDFKIVLTFFSPSGFEIRKNYPGADYVFYLPLDTRPNAVKFISLINPEKVFFIKYEYWFCYFKEIKKRNVPLYVVSAVFRPRQKFFRWYGNFFRKMLDAVTFFFVQDDESAQLLGSIGISNCKVTGDTRFDRVAELAANSKPVPLVEKFKNGNKILVYGSTWEKDEQLVFSMLSDKTFAKSGLKLIIVPHEINEARINRLMHALKDFNAIRFSTANEETISSSNVLVIDNIGMLSSLYQYGSFAFVGGGFGKGIHNILEAAVFGMPVFFGPNYEKFREATQLIRYGGAFSIHSSGELKMLLTNFLNDENKLREVSAVSKHYVQSGKGATEKILEFVNGPRKF